jgi:hypothetical protein
VSARPYLRARLARGAAAEARARPSACPERVPVIGLRPRCPRTARTPCAFAPVQRVCAKVARRRDALVVRRSTRASVRIHPTTGRHRAATTSDPPSRCRSSRVWHDSEVLVHSNPRGHRRSRFGPSCRLSTPGAVPDGARRDLAGRARLRQVITPAARRWSRCSPRRREAADLHRQGAAARARRRRGGVLSGWIRCRRSLERMLTCSARLPARTSPAWPLPARAC